VEGYDLFLPKPYTAAELLGAIDRLLGERVSAG